MSGKKKFENVDFKNVLTVLSELSEFFRNYTSKENSDSENNSSKENSKPEDNTSKENSEPEQLTKQTTLDSWLSKVNSSKAAASASTSHKTINIAHGTSTEVENHSLNPLQKVSFEITTTNANDNAISNVVEPCIEMDTLHVEGIKPCIEYVEDINLQNLVSHLVPCISNASEVSHIVDCQSNASDITHSNTKEATKTLHINFGNNSDLVELPNNIKVTTDELNCARESNFDKSGCFTIEKDQLEVAKKVVANNVNNSTTEFNSYNNKNYHNSIEKFTINESRDVCFINKLQDFNLISNDSNAENKSSEDGIYLEKGINNDMVSINLDIDKSIQMQNETLCKDLNSFNDICQDLQSNNMTSTNSSLELSFLNNESEVLEKKENSLRIKKKIKNCKTKNSELSKIKRVNENASDKDCGEKVKHSYNLRGKKNTPEKKVNSHFSKVGGDINDEELGKESRRRKSLSKSSMRYLPNKNDSPIKKSVCKNKRDSIKNNEISDDRLPEKDVIDLVQRNKRRPSKTPIKCSPVKSTRNIHNKNSKINLVTSNEINQEIVSEKLSESKSKADHNCYHKTSTTCLSAKETVININNSDKEKDNKKANNDSFIKESICNKKKRDSINEFSNNRKSSEKDDSIVQKGKRSPAKCSLAKRLRTVRHNDKKMNPVTLVENIQESSATCMLAEEFVNNTNISDEEKQSNNTSLIKESICNKNKPNFINDEIRNDKSPKKDDLIVMQGKSPIKASTKCSPVKGVRNVHHKNSKLSVNILDDINQENDNDGNLSKSEGIKDPKSSLEISINFLLADETENEINTSDKRKDNKKNLNNKSLIKESIYKKKKRDFIKDNEISIDKSLEKDNLIIEQGKRTPVKSSHVKCPRTVCQKNSKMNLVTSGENQKKNSSENLSKSKSIIDHNSYLETSTTCLLADETVNNANISDEEKGNKKKSNNSGLENKTTKKKRYKKRTEQKSYMCLDNVLHNDETHNQSKKVAELPCFDKNISAPKNKRLKKSVTNSLLHSSHLSSSNVLSKNDDHMLIVTHEQNSNEFENQIIKDFPLNSKSNNDVCNDSDDFIQNLTIPSQDISVKNKDVSEKKKIKRGSKKQLDEFLMDVSTPEKSESMNNDNVNIRKKDNLIINVRVQNEFAKSTSRNVSIAVNSSLDASATANSSSDSSATIRSSPLSKFSEKAKNENDNIPLKKGRLQEEKQYKNSPDSNTVNHSEYTNVEDDDKIVHENSDPKMLQAHDHHRKKIKTHPKCVDEDTLSAWKAFIENPPEEVKAIYGENLDVLKYFPPNDLAIKALTECADNPNAQVTFMKRETSDEVSDPLSEYYLLLEN